jgi:hypothetical protein
MPVNGVLDSNRLVVLHLHGAVNVECGNVYQLPFVFVGYSFHGFGVMDVPMEYERWSLPVAGEVRWRVSKGVMVQQDWAPTMPSDTLYD